MKIFMKFMQRSIVEEFHDWMLFLHFPNSSQPSKGLDRRLIVVSRLTKWMIGMFGIQSTGVNCPWHNYWLVSLVLGPLISCFSLSSNNMQVSGWTNIIIAISDNVLYGNMMKSITFGDRWQVVWGTRIRPVLGIYSGMVCHRRTDLNWTRTVQRQLTDRFIGRRAKEILWGWSWS